MSLPLHPASTIGMVLPASRYDHLCRHADPDRVMQADVGLATHIPVMDLHLTEAQAELLVAELNRQPSANQRQRNEKDVGPWRQMRETAWATYGSRARGDAVAKGREPHGSSGARLPRAWQRLRNCSLFHAAQNGVGPSAGRLALRKCRNSANV